MTELRNRIAGCMYGLLVGDALGCPREGIHPTSIQRQFGKVDDWIDALVIRPTNFQPVKTLIDLELYWMMQNLKNDLMAYD